MPESQQLLAEYNRLLYLGLNYTAKGQYDKAVEIFDRQITLTDGQGQLLRYLIISYINKANVYVKAGYNGKAIDMNRCTTIWPTRRIIKAIMPQAVFTTISLPNHTVSSPRVSMW